MDIKTNFKATVLIVLSFLMAASAAFPQSAKLPVPRQEKLLNGLGVLIWNTSGSDKVSVKLRMHHGSAFDPESKEGTMAILGNILFPNTASREFFEQDLGGSIDITTNYDYIQFSITANSDKVIDVLQTLSNAIANAQIDKETTDLVRDAQIIKVKQLESDPGYVADKAVEERLLGDFAYGRPVQGTVESLQKIDFADIIFAKNKFLTSDSATLIVSGNVKSDLVYRAVRRYFGGWVKADSEIPATFRLPDSPEKTLKILESSKANTSELRFAFRGVARNDKHFFASEIIENILDKRISAQEKGKVVISSESHLLPGLVRIAFKDWNIGLIKRDGNKIELPADLDKTVAKFFAQPISVSEFSNAKTEVLKRFSSENLTELWLDVDTFKLASFAKDFQAAQNVSLENVKSIFEKFKNEPVASVLVFQNPKQGETPKSSDQD